MNHNTKAYPAGGAPKFLDPAIASGLDELGRLTAFVKAQLEWMNRCVEEDFRGKNGYARQASKDAALLNHFLFRVAVAGVQSAGKTTVLNTLLGFPYMPTAEVLTTCCATSVMYGEKPDIVVVSRKDKVEHRVSVGKLPERVFRNLKAYVVECLIARYCATSLNCLLEPCETDMDGHLIVDESMLHVDYANLKHRVALILHVLSFYVDQNSLPEEQLEETREVNQRRAALMTELGIPEDITEFDIVLEVNSPVLKNGLVFVDLPGTGAVAKAGNGMSGHDEIQLSVMATCQAVMLVFIPNMAEDTVKPLDNVIMYFKNRKIEHNRIGTSLIPVLNQMDRPGAAGCSTKIDPILKQRGLDFSFAKGMFKISAARAEKRFYDINPDLPMEYSSVARRLSGLVPGLVQLNDNMIRQVQETEARQSNFDALYHYIENYADASRETICLEVLLNIFRAVNDYLNSVIHSLTIQEGMLNLFVENSDQLVRMIRENVIAPFDSDYAQFSTKFFDLQDAFITMMLPEKLDVVKFKFLGKIEAEHEKMVSDLKDKSALLVSNIWKDIVLWRGEKRREYVEPNYSHYKAMETCVRDNQYEDAFTYLRDEIGVIHRMASDQSAALGEDMEKAVLQLTETLRARCRQLEDELAKQGENGKNSLDALTAAFEVIMSYCDTMDASIHGKIAALSDSETETINRALQEALQVRAVAQTKLQQANLERFNKIVTNGAFMQNTFLVYPWSVSSVISEMASQDATSTFLTCIETACSGIVDAYQGFYENKRHKLFLIYQDTKTSLSSMIHSVVISMENSREYMESEVALMREFLSGVEPFIPTDGASLGLSDSHALKQWEVITEEYNKTLELLKAYRKKA